MQHHRLVLARCVAFYDVTDVRASPPVASTKVATWSQRHSTTLGSCKGRDASQLIIDRWERVVHDIITMYKYLRWRRKCVKRSIICPEGQLYVEVGIAAYIDGIPGMDRILDGLHVLMCLYLAYQKSSQRQF